MKPSMQVEEGADREARSGPVRRPQGAGRAPHGAGGRAHHRNPSRREARPAGGRDRPVGRRAARGAGDDELARFESFSGADPDSLDRDQIRALLAESGLWTAIRQRPFGHVPSPDGDADALFITAIDTHPHAPLPEVVLAGRLDDFRLGARLVAKLIDGPTYLCVGEHSELGDEPPARTSGSRRFAGPHPAGTVGVHIHTLRPVNRSRKVWHVGYQDVAAIGSLFRTGRLDVTRVISIAGAGIADPRLERSRIGACVSDLVASDLAPAKANGISA